MTETPLRLHAADGTPLAASHFVGRDQEFVVLASATATPRGFYRRFAQYAQSRGLHVLTLDYRGVGDSRRGPLKGFVMDYADWSRQDLAAAVDWAAQRGRVWLAGHSLGGHAIGLLPRPEQVQAAFVCGTGAGWHGWMPQPERFKVWLMWNAIGPVLTRLYGYHPMSKLGLGEDLPLGVYRDWKRWCRHPHYFFDDPDACDLVAGFDRVQLPIAALVSTDDQWSPPASADAFMQGYRQAPVERINVSPAELGLAQIGHMGYFRTSVGEVLWPRMVAWLQNKGMRAVPAQNP